MIFLADDGINNLFIPLLSGCETSLLAAMTSGVFGKTEGSLGGM